MSGILAGLLENRATKTPTWSVKETPPARVVKYYGQETVAGPDVTPDTALELIPVFTCVRVLAESLASLPLILYRRSGGDAKERAYDHPLYAILHDIANPEMTSYTLRETLMGQVVTWGNSFAEIEWTRGGTVKALWPLRPDKMGLRRAENGALQYIYYLPNGQPKTFDSRRIFHLRGLGGNGLWGYTPVGLARQGIGLGLATEEYGGRFFSNGARPGGVLMYPGELSQEAFDRLQKSFDESYKGLSNAQRTAILEEGVTYQAIGVKPDEAQFLQTRKFQVTEIARLFRVPPHMVADLDRATFSNVEQQSLEFVVYTLTPWLARWEKQILLDLLTQAERSRLFAEHTVNGLLRGDIATRYMAYHQGRNDGWLSANDIRALENFNPIPGGDMYLVPLNMVPADQMAAQGDQAQDAGSPANSGDAGQDARALAAPQAQAIGSPANSGDTVPGTGSLTERREADRSVAERHRLGRVYAPLFSEVLERVLRREANDIRVAARRWVRDDWVRFSNWLDDFYRDHYQFVWDNLRGTVEAYGELVGGHAHQELGEAPDLADPDRRYLRRWLDAYSSRHVTRSETEVREAIREAQAQAQDPDAPADALEVSLGDVFQGWQDTRAGAVAQKESYRLNNALAKSIYTLAGVLELRWVAFGDSCPYCRALNGRVVGITGWFIGAGEAYEPEGAEAPLTPRSNIGHAPAHDGCDCLVRAVI